MVVFIECHEISCGIRDIFFSFGFFFRHTLSIVEVMDIFGLLISFVTIPGTTQGVKWIFVLLCENIEVLSILMHGSRKEAEACDNDYFLNVKGVLEVGEQHVCHE
jgi:hypothetical protein